MLFTGQIECQKSEEFSLNYFPFCMLALSSHRPLSPQFPPTCCYNKTWLLDMSISFDSHRQVQCPDSPGAYTTQVPSQQWWQRPVWCWIHHGLEFKNLNFKALCLPTTNWHSPSTAARIKSWSLSFWLTSLCIMGSSFIHLIRTDSNEFFLMTKFTTN